MERSLRARDFSGQPRLSCGESPADKNEFGIDIGSDSTRVKGIEVANANDTGILVQGSHDFVENCDVHDSADTGIKISSSSGFTGSGTFNTILNCDSHHNNDPQCNGANADGFGAKDGGGDGNVSMVAALGTTPTTVGTCSHGRRP